MTNPSEPPEEEGALAGQDSEAEENSASGDGRHHLNPARLEVRVRRLALLGLVLVPVVYFLVQSLR